MTSANPVGMVIIFTGGGIAVEADCANAVAKTRNMDTSPKEFAAWPIST